MTILIWRGEPKQVNVGDRYLRNSDQKEFEVLYVTDDLKHTAITSVSLWYNKQIILSYNLFRHFTKYKHYIMRITPTVSANKNMYVRFKYYLTDLHINNIY